MSKRRIAMVAVPALVAALAINLGIRALAVGRFEVPAGALPFVFVIFVSFMSVFGPAFGCYMVFRHPSPTSMRNFLLVGTTLALMGVLAQVVRFAAIHHHVRGMVVGVFLELVGLGLSVPLLLRLVARTAAARPAAGAGE